MKNLLAVPLDVAKHGMAGPAERKKFMGAAIPMLIPIMPGGEGHIRFDIVKNSGANEKAVGTIENA